MCAGSSIKDSCVFLNFEDMNFSGIIVGAAVFVLIGLCHPLVIKAEYHIGRKAWVLFLIVGLVFAYLSFFLSGMIESIISGAAAFSFFWGILEMFEQEKRVLNGWFPENPKRKEYYDRKRVSKK